MKFFKKLGWALAYIFVAITLGIKFLNLKKMAKKYNFDPESVDAETRFNAVYKFAKTYLYFKQVDIKLHGKEKLEDKTMFFVCNHVSDLDPIVLFKVIHEQQCPRPIFLAKIELTLEKYAPILSLIDVIYIDRENLRQTVEAVNQQQEVLKDKESVVVFPEGTRNQDNPDKLLEFKAASLTAAYETFTTIQPIVINNTKDLVKTHVFKKRDRTVHVKFLKSYQPINFVNIAKDKFAEKLQSNMQQEYDSLLKELSENAKSRKK